MLKKLLNTKNWSQKFSKSQDGTKVKTKIFSLRFYDFSWFFGVNLLTPALSGVAKDIPKPVPSDVYPNPAPVIPTST